MVVKLRSGERRTGEAQPCAVHYAGGAQGVDKRCHGGESCPPILSGRVIHFDAGVDGFTSFSEQYAERWYVSNVSAAPAEPAGGTRRKMWKTLHTEAVILCRWRRVRASAMSARSE